MTVSRFNINMQTGLLEPVIQRASPHYDDRPEGIGIDMIVIHGISLPPREFGSDTIENFFCGKFDALTHPALTDIRNVCVSSHLLIKRSGEIIQFVPFTKRAWHAGESFFAGRAGCNDFSIGIELEGTDDIPYEKMQYVQLEKVIRLLMQTYPAITLERIVGHSDIAPGRKTDPGHVFDWVYLKGTLV